MGFICAQSFQLWKAEMLTFLFNINDINVWLKLESLIDTPFQEAKKKINVF